MNKLDTAKMLIENCLGASLREATRDSLRMALREIEEYQLSVKYLDLANVSNSLLSGLPENMPLYKDSGLWQLRTDDMDDVILQQSSDESDDMFIAKCRNIQRKKESKDSVCAYCGGSGKAMNVKYDLPCQVCKGTGIAN